MPKPTQKDIAYQLTTDDARLLSESLAGFRIKKMRSLNAVAYRRAYGLPIPAALQADADAVERAVSLRRGLIVSINRVTKKGAA